MKTCSGACIYYHVIISNNNEITTVSPDKLNVKIFCDYYGENIKDLSKEIKCTCTHYKSYNDIKIKI